MHVHLKFIVKSNLAFDIYLLLAQSFINALVLPYWKQDDLITKLDDGMNVVSLYHVQCRCHVICKGRYVVILYSWSQRNLSYWWGNWQWFYPSGSLQVKHALVKSRFIWLWCALCRLYVHTISNEYPLKWSSLSNTSTYRPHLIEIRSMS